MSVVAVTRIHGIAGRREALRELMRDTEAKVRREPGCRDYRFAAGVGEPDEYVHVQEWDTEEAFERHQRSSAFQAYAQGLVELHARPSEMRVHRIRETVTPTRSGPMDPRTAD
jgi:quinol monooxygenase YgiN